MTTRKFETAYEAMRKSGKPYAVATVVRTVAPTSAKAGDRALLDADGILAGWVGGGCALPAVKRNAAAALAERYQKVGKRLHLRHLSEDCRRLLDKAGDLVEVNISEDPHYHVATNRSVS